MRIIQNISQLTSHSTPSIVMMVVSTDALSASPPNPSAEHILCQLQVSFVSVASVHQSYPYNNNIIPGPIPVEENKLRAYYTTATTIWIFWNVSASMYEITYNYNIQGCMEQGSGNTTTITDRDTRTFILENLHENSLYDITLSIIDDEGSAFSGSVDMGSNTYTIEASTDTSSMLYITAKSLRVHSLSYL